MQQGVKTALAFGSVLMIWGTTPLAILWSSEGLHYLVSVTARMSLAACFALALTLILEKRLPYSLSALRSYAAGSLGIFGGMVFVYWAAPFVSSGLISMMHGLAPVLTGVLAYYLLNESLGWRKLVGVLLSLLGLMAVFYDGLHISDINVYAIAALLMSVALYSLCGVMTKKVAAPISPLQQTTGTLIMSSVAFVVVCAMVQPALPTAMSLKAGLSLVYLASVCSVLGFFLYFYLLKVSTAGSVALITLLSPVVALTLGIQLNGETFSPLQLTGGGLIALGLLAYQWPLIKSLFAMRPQWRGRLRVS